MDLIGALTSQLGIKGDQAEALAGAVIGGVKDTVTEKVGAAEASEIDGAVPELAGWAEKARTLTGDSPSNDGGLLGAASSMLGGGGATGLLGAMTGGGGMDAGMLARLLEKTGLSGGMVTTVTPLVLDFLKDRLPEELVSKVAQAVPLLSALGGTGGGLGGALGGLFGGD